MKNLLSHNFTALSMWRKTRDTNESGCSGNTIGPDNVISGNGLSAAQRDGIRLNGSSNNTIQGNKIGTNAAGTNALGNTGNGILVENSANNNPIGPDNVISGNGLTSPSTARRHGIAIVNSSSNMIKGNKYNLAQRHRPGLPDPSRKRDDVRGASD
jgi:parallel beta-helix repeat protein